MEPTGRRYDGPTDALVELVDGDGLVHLAIALHARYRGLDGVRAAVEVGRGFLERPMVFGVAPLVAADLGAGQLVYPTGPVVSLAELLDRARVARTPMGPRAAAELAWLATLVLTEAAEAGPMAGVFCHGDLTPWRLALREDGELLVLGYGIPEVEWLRMQRTGADAPLVDGFRYAPPERITATPEGLAGDLYSLALVTAEVASGRPVRGGEPEANLAAVLRTRPGSALKGLGLPDALAGALAPQLAADPSARPSPRAFTRQLAALAQQLEGPSLAEAVSALRDGDAAQRTSRPLEGIHATRAFDVGLLQALAEEARAQGLVPEPTPAPAKKRRRRKRGATAETPAPAPSPARASGAPKRAPKTESPPPPAKADAPKRAKAPEPVPDAPKRAEKAPEPLPDAPKRAKAPEPVPDAPKRAKAPEPVPDAPKRAKAPEPLPDAPKRAEKAPEPLPDAPKRAEKAPEPVPDAPKRAKAPEPDEAPDEGTRAPDAPSRPRRARRPTRKG